MSDTSKETEAAKPSVEPTKSLPEVGVLVKDAWNLLKIKALKFLTFYAILIGVYFLMVLVIGLLMFGLSVAGVALNPNAKDIFNIFAQPATMGVIGIIILLITVAYVAFAMAIQAGFILLLADEKNEHSAFSYLKKGFAFAWPLFLASLLSMLLIMGGFVLLIIPGVIIMFFLAFSSFNIVLAKKGPMESIRMSVSMVKQHFGAVLGRMLLLMGIYVLVQVVVGQVANALKESGLGGIIFIMVLSFGAGLYAMTYVYTLYKQVRSAYNESKQASMTWIWVVAVIGLIIIILMFNGIARALNSNDFKNAFTEEFQKGMEQGMEKEMGNTTYDNVVDKAMMESLMKMGNVEDQFDALLTEARDQAGVPTIESDQRLCAYATRRLKQLKEYGGNDDFAGFYEDLSDPTTSRAYFPNGVHVYNRIWERTGSPTESIEMLNAWTKSTDDNSLLSAKYTNGCIRSDDDFVTVVLIGNE